MIFSTVKEFVSKYKLLFTMVTTIILIVLPIIIQQDYIMGIICRILLYATLAGALNVINGYSGQMCLGLAGFIAIGAYTEAILSTKFGVSFWILLIIGGILSALLAGLLAIPTLHLSGTYLAIITLAFSEVVRLIALNWNGVTGGSLGIKNIQPPDLFGISFLKPQQYYYIFLVIAIIFLIATRRVIKSRVGRAWMSIREDVLAARSLGVETSKYRIINFMYGAFWAGVIGAAYAPYTRYIDSTYFTLDESFNILSMVIIGGQGTLIGPFFGASVATLLTEVLRSFNEWRMVAYAILIIAMMWIRPEGLIGATNSILSGNISRKNLRLKAKNS